MHGEATLPQHRFSCRSCGSAMRLGHQPEEGMLSAAGTRASVDRWLASAVHRGGIVRVQRLVGRVMWCLLAASGIARAQAVSEVQGIVQDGTGAVLPGVDVKMTQTETGLVRTAVTGPEGGYLLPALPPGPYRLEATLQGFRNCVQNGIVLQVGVGRGIVGLLVVGSVSDAVTVALTARMLGTQ